VWLDKYLAQVRSKIATELDTGFVFLTPAGVSMANCYFTKPHSIRYGTMQFLVPVKGIGSDPQQILSLLRLPVPSRRAKEKPHGSPKRPDHKQTHNCIENCIVRI
jgi:hypothetical protein